VGGRTETVPGELNEISRGGRTQESQGRHLLLKNNTKEKDTWYEERKEGKKIEREKPNQLTKCHDHTKGEEKLVEWRKGGQ